MQKARMLLLIPLLATQGCGLFVAGRPTVLTQSAGCSSLIPDSWKRAVEGAQLPEGNTISDWIVFGDQQTGKLDIANGRTIDSITIVARCEERDAAAIKKATRPRFLGIPL